MTLLLLVRRRRLHSGADVREWFAVLLGGRRILGGRGMIRVAFSDHSDVDVGRRPERAGRRKLKVGWMVRIHTVLRCERRLGG